MKKFAVIRSAYAPLYQKGFNEFDDDIFCGWAAEVIESTPEYDLILTHYGVKAYLEPGQLMPVGESYLRERKSLTVTAPFLDVLEGAKVEALPLITLPKGSFLEAVGEEENGYVPVRLPDGKEGYAFSRWLSTRLDSDGMLFSDDGEKWLLEQPRPSDREAFTDSVIGTAKEYLGVQYRWGGKSSFGIDCSGLVFMAYMRNGFLVSRSSRMSDDRGFTKVSADELQPGDKLHFTSPGHIAIYIGDGRFIHSTGNPAYSGVGISSFDPEDPLFLPGIMERFAGADRIF